MSDDSHAATTSYVRSSAVIVPTPPDQTTYRKAVNKIRSNIKNALRKRVHVYTFNIPSEELVSVYTLLDKEDERKSMRVTYSDDHNFIVRYMPSRAHEVAYISWNFAVSTPLMQLTPPPHPLQPPGCFFIGAATTQLKSRQKQADASIVPHPNPSGRPSVVLEVGSSESLAQLKIDARLWLEDMPEVQLVVILSIDPPIDAHPNLPRITIQLWRGFLPNHPVRGGWQREARVVWEADWTHGATPLYILLSDVFRGRAPAAYGDNDRVHLDTANWRQDIITNYV